MNNPHNHLKVGKAKGSPLFERPLKRFIKNDFNSPNGLSSKFGQFISGQSIGKVNGPKPSDFEFKPREIFHASGMSGRLNLGISNPLNLNIEPKFRCGNIGSILKNPEKKNPILPHLNAMNLPINMRIDGNSKNQDKSQGSPELESGRPGKIFLRIKFRSNGRFSEFKEKDPMFQPVKEILPILGNENNPGISIPISQSMSGHESLSVPSEFHHPLLLPLKQINDKSGK